MMEAVAWLCRSPRRLAVAAVTVLTVVLVGGSALFGHAGRGGGGGSEAGRAPTVTASAIDSAQVPNANPYVSAAVSFVKLWSQLKPGETSQQWQAALTPLTTADLGQALRTTDTDKLPGVAPAGQPVVRFVAQTSALVAVSLNDGSSVLVTLVSGDSGPLVSDIQPNAGN